MALDYFVTKFYSLTYKEKQDLKDFFLSDDIEKWGAFHVLVPIKEKKSILALVTVNNLSVFDKIEEDLLGEEIEPVEYANAAKWWNTEYQSFYPSADNSDFSS